MRNDMQIGCLLFFHSFLLVLHTDVTQESDGDNGTDDAHHAERIGAGIAVGDGRGTGSENLIAGFCCRTKAGRVGDGTTKHAYHHGKIAGIICGRGIAIVENEEV